jgi:hypothetical protein
MGYGAKSVFSDTIASGASTSAGINLARSWNTIMVQVGTMSTAAAVGVQNSVDSGVTWYNVFHEVQNSSTVGAPQLYIPSGVGTNGGSVGLPLNQLMQVRFVATAVVSGGVGFKIICGD